MTAARLGRFTCGTWEAEVPHTDILKQVVVEAAEKRKLACR